jgi:hypothetical protein
MLQKARLDRSLRNRLKAFTKLRNWIDLQSAQRSVILLMLQKKYLNQFEFRNLDNGDMDFSLD